MFGLARAPAFIRMKWLNFHGQLDHGFHSNLTKLHPGFHSSALPMLHIIDPVNSLSPGMRGGHYRPLFSPHKTRPSNYTPLGPIRYIGPLTPLRYKYYRPRRYVSQFLPTGIINPSLSHKSHRPLHHPVFYPRNLQILPTEWSTSYCILEYIHQPR